MLEKEEKEMPKAQRETGKTAKEDYSGIRIPSFDTPHSSVYAFVCKNELVGKNDTGINDTAGSVGRKRGYRRRDGNSV